MKQPYSIDRLRELSAKWLDGNITEAEKAEFNEYYDQFNDTELDLSATNTSDPHQIALRILARLKEHIREEQETKTWGGLIPFNRKSLRWMAAACIIGLIVWAGISNWRHEKNTEIPLLTVNTVEGKTNKIILPDSTIVWMKPSSTLTYPKSFSGTERNISFTGEALFEVTKDSKHPFIITSGNYSIRVLGTSFNIRQSEKKNFELMVLTGKVAVRQDNKQGKSVSTLVTANHKLRAIADTFKVTATVEQEAILLVQQTEYLMSFRNDEMKEVISRLEKKFNIQIEVTNKQIYSCRLTADLTDQSLNRSLRLISDALNLQCRQENGRIYLHGNGCE